MIKVLFIMAGGALGSGARYWISGLAQRMTRGTFPVGTLSVNIIGSFIAGFLWGLTEYFEWSPSLRLFTFIGFLGGFTTFSTFSLECMQLLRVQRYSDALLNILTSNMLAILFVITGLMGSKLLINYLKS